jgi:hypothetical protein
VIVPGAPSARISNITGGIESMKDVEFLSEAIETEVI